MTSVNLTPAASKAVNEIAKLDGIKKDEALEKLVKTGFSRLNSLRAYAAKNSGAKTKAKKAAKMKAKKAPAKAKNGAPKRRVARPKKQKAAGAKAN